MDRAALRQVLAIASSQFELVSVHQAANVGVTAAMLRAAAKHGWLRHYRNGIYVVAGAGPSRWRPVVAATLAAGPTSVVSHTTAAMVHRFYGVHSDDIELTVPSRRSLDGVRVHRSSTLEPSDVQQRNGVTLTTPIRTIVDLAARFDDPLLGLILDEGAIARLWTAEAISARLEQARRGFAGVADLRPLLAQRLGEGNPDSKLEQRVIRLIKRHAPGYTLHHRVVLDGEVIDMDIAWVEQKVDGEVDGMRTRAVSRTKFERTCRRENILAAHGWRIVHFTDKMDEKALVAQVAPLFVARRG